MVDVLSVLCGLWRRGVRWGAAERAHGIREAEGTGLADARLGECSRGPPPTHHHHDSARERPV